MPPPELSLHVAQGAGGGTHASAPAASSTSVSPNAGAASLDTIRPTEGSSAMGNGQAGDGELNAVDGDGHGFRCERVQCSR